MHLAQVGLAPSHLIFLRLHVRHPVERPRLTILHVYRMAPKRRAVLSAHLFQLAKIGEALRRRKEKS